MKASTTTALTPTSRKDSRMAAKPFFNLYSQGFIRAAVCVPEVRVADVAFNTLKTIALAQKAAKEKALLAIFPELGLSAYSNEEIEFVDGIGVNIVKSGVEIGRASCRERVCYVV